MEPEPIPLRDLKVLLNYERVIADPALKGFRLLKSSVADTALVDEFKAQHAETFGYMHPYVE